MPFASQVLREKETVIAARPPQHLKHIYPVPQIPTLRCALGLLDVR